MHCQQSTLVFAPKMSRLFLDGSPNATRKPQSQVSCAPAEFVAVKQNFGKGTFLIHQCRHCGQNCHSMDSQEMSRSCRNRSPSATRASTIGSCDHADPVHHNHPDTSAECICLPPRLTLRTTLQLIFTPRNVQVVPKQVTQSVSRAQIVMRANTDPDCHSHQEH